MNRNRNILLCTLGASWAVIPEVLAFVDPALPLYHRHPQRDRLMALLQRHKLRPPDEIWVCTTHGDRPAEGIEALQAWWDLMGLDRPLRIWRAVETDEVASQLEGDQVRELIYRAVLKAGEYCRDGQLLLSLAGGRKTMSADLQRAGMIFGCQALLHVIIKEPLPDGLRSAGPSAFTAPLAAELAGSIIPMVVGAGERSELLDVDVEGHGRITSEQFGLPQADAIPPCNWSWDGVDSLADEIASREREGSRLLGNYLRQLAQREHHGNWRSLYRLPPAVIERLRGTMLVSKHHDWVQRLPKADLHRHIGGAIDLAAQRRVGEAVWWALTGAERDAAIGHVSTLLRQTEWPWDWPQRLRRQGERTHNVAALLVKAGEAQLEHNLFQVTGPRHGLKTRHPQGFSAYERPGELTGSAILRHAAAWRPYAAEVIRQAKSEGLSYLELRGSPQKYADKLQDQLAFLHQLEEEFESGDGPRIRFILIADRRNPDSFAQLVQLACRARDELPRLIGGIDVAGDEASGDMDIDHLSKALLGVFERCLPITIHAGEGEDPRRIWEAGYHLHADRIGHGLTLLDHPELLAHFRDRRICVELCPSSNREVVGFRDPAFEGSENDPIYPLAEYWQRGLSVTLCTDNPGISRTSLVDEYLTAARMNPGTMSCWDTLALIRQGFINAFLPAAERERLLKQTDAEIFRLLATAQRHPQKIEIGR